MGYSKDVQSLIDKAELLGFHVDQGCSGGGHIRLQHGGSGEEYIIASTPSDWRSRKNALAALERIAGRKLPRANHRRSRKAVKSSGFSIERSRRERYEPVVTAADRLEAEYIQLIKKFVYYAHGGEASRTDIRKCLPIAKRMLEIEAVFKELGHPFDRFNPNDHI